MKDEKDYGPRNLSMQSGDKCATGSQGLGYIYQPRLALLKLLEQPESTGIIIEGQDDLEFFGEAGNRSLASLKHKAEGDRLTKLSSDFWKLIRLWLENFKSSGGTLSALNFYLYTTSKVSEGTFLVHFLIDQPTQVYFPSEEIYRSVGGSIDETESDANMKAVCRLFQLLRKFVEEHGPGFQLIVAEHANLRDDWYQTALVEQPWSKPPALVPDGWPTQ